MIRLKKAFWFVVEEILERVLGHKLTMRYLIAWGVVEPDEMDWSYLA
jgi:hypothetical protein